MWIWLLQYDYKCVKQLHFFIVFFKNQADVNENKLLYSLRTPTGGVSAMFATFQCMKQKKVLVLNIILQVESMINVCVTMFWIIV